MARRVLTNSLTSSSFIVARSYDNDGDGGDDGVGDGDGESTLRSAPAQKTFSTLLCSIRTRVFLSSLTVSRALRRSLIMARLNALRF